MKSLFIIGNGFDLSHGLKTSYENFHEYLKEEYPDSNGEALVVPEPIFMPDGDVQYDDDATVNLLMCLINNAEPNGEKWSDLERSMGYFDFDEAFDFLTEELDEDDEPDMWKNSYNNEDLARNLVEPVQSIVDYFSEWVDTIDINEEVKIKDDFLKIIDKDNDFFLTFNYTKTLEVLYKARKVCHIHGEQGGKLLFGHGNDTDYYEENMNKNIGSEAPLQEIQYALRKNTEKAIKDNEKFFSSLSEDIDKIYSYGFSFGDVDKIYIEEICNILKTENITWYFNDFEDVNKRQEYEQMIRFCGFKGHVNIYHIS